MRVIFDSNVVLSSIGKKSKYRPVYDAFLNKQIDLMISNEVLLEYEEILMGYINQNVSENFSEMLLNSTNIEKYEIYYKWALITEDYDDNKFVDLAIVSNADYIVTNDRHFNILKSIAFPKVNIINLDDFFHLIIEMFNG